MTITVTEAREIAGRWGEVAESEPLLAFARTGLVEDRKRLLDAIDYVRQFLKQPDEIDRLREFATCPCAFERAARESGWKVEDDAIVHMHDYDKSVIYTRWQDCCENEDIILGRDEDEHADNAKSRLRRRRAVR